MKIKTPITLTLLALILLISPLQAKGYLSITSNENETIFVNSTYIGTGNQDLKLNEGTYHVEIKDTFGSIIKTDTIRIKDHEQTTLTTTKNTRKNTDFKKKSSEPLLNRTIKLESSFGLLNESTTFQKGHSLYIGLTPPIKSPIEVALGFSLQKRTPKTTASPFNSTLTVFSPSIDIRIPKRTLSTNYTLGLLLSLDSISYSQETNQNMGTNLSSGMGISPHLDLEFNLYKSFSIR